MKSEKKLTAILRKNLKLLKNKKRFTYRELGTILMCSHNHLCNFANGRKQLTYEIGKRLELFLKEQLGNYEI